VRQTVHWRYVPPPDASTHDLLRALPGDERRLMTSNPPRDVASPNDGPAVSAGSAPSPEEERLVAEAQRGSIDAFNQLVRMHERQVYNVALRMVGQTDAAEDVTQDTFLLAYKSLHQFRGGLFRAWLLRIATNRCYDEIATITGISLGTVKSRLSRGRGRLREILREFPGGAELFARYRRRYDEGVEG
jgi:hypothetical protein